MCVPPYKYRNILTVLPKLTGSRAEKAVTKIRLIPVDSRPAVNLFAGTEDLHHWAKYQACVPLYTPG